MLSIKCPYKQARGGSSKQPKFHQVTEMKKKKTLGKNKLSQGGSSLALDTMIFFILCRLYILSPIPNTENVFKNHYLYDL